MKNRVQVQKVKSQVRAVRPKVTVPTGQQDQRKLQEKFIKSGGLLVGRSPEFVIKLGIIVGSISVLFVLLAVEVLIGPVRPADWSTRAFAALGWLMPVITSVVLIAPAFRLALKDRKQKPRLVQGQVLGAASVSTSPGLGIVIIRTRNGIEQLLVPKEYVTKIPGNVIQASILVTPGLQHVRSFSLIGARQVPRKEPEVPDFAKRMGWIMMFVPAFMSAGIVLATQALSFAPVESNTPLLHLLIALGVTVAVAVAIWGGARLYQNRVMEKLQALMPKQ